MNGEYLRRKMWMKYLIIPDLELVIFWAGVQE